MKASFLSYKLTNPSYSLLLIKMTNPMSLKPPLKFGTVPWTYTENAVKKHFPNMHLYMKEFMKMNVTEGVNAVKSGLE